MLDRATTCNTSPKHGYRERGALHEDTALTPNTTKPMRLYAQVLRVAAVLCLAGNAAAQGRPSACSTRATRRSRSERSRSGMDRPPIGAACELARENFAFRPSGLHPGYRAWDADSHSRRSTGIDAVRHSASLARQKLTRNTPRSRTPPGREPQGASAK